MINKETVNSGIIGGVVGDALGVPYEFSSRTEMIEYPATKMRGYGTYNQPPGTWSDDSSMTLATLDSLVDGVDYEDMMARFCSWYSSAHYTPHGEVFDIGTTTSIALDRYIEEDKSVFECGLTDEHSNGNGSLMRIMPAVLYANAKELSISQQIEFINNVSGLTHAHSISKASCNIYNFIAQEVINHPEQSFKASINKGIDNSRQYYDNSDYPCFNKIYNSLFSLYDDHIFSRGYVVDSLEVALYCCYHTTNYRDAVLRAVNTGGDTDTNAMIAGALAGLYYGYDCIPRDWLEKIVKLDYIKGLCDRFHDSLLK